MNRYPPSHIIRAQRVNRIRAPWLQIIGLEVAKLERVARAANEFTSRRVSPEMKADGYHFPEILLDMMDLCEALKEVEYMFDE